MSNLLQFIADWQERNPGAEYQELFRSHLHQHPYYLRYALDRQRKDLFMVYQTDRSDKNDAIVKECNGIILDKGDYHIVAYGMKGRIDETENYHLGNFPIDFAQYDLEEVDDGA